MNPLICGSVGFRWMPGTLQAGIRFFSRSPGEARVDVNHAWAHYDALDVVHAIWPKIAREPWETVRRATEDNGGAWIVLRPTAPLDPWQCRRWRAALDDVIGRRYAWAECLLQAADRGLGKLLRLRRPPLLARRLQDVLPGMMCSHVVGRALGRAGLVPRNSEARYGDPDDLYDLLLWLGWQIAAKSLNWDTKGTASKAPPPGQTCIESPAARQQSA